MRCVWMSFSRININTTKWAEDNTWALVPRRVLCTPKSFKCWSSSCCAVRLTCTLLETRFDFLKPHTYWISLYLVSYDTQEPKRGSMWYVALTSGIKRNRKRFTELRTKQTGQNKILAKLNTAHIYNQGYHFIFDVKNAMSKKLERIKHYKAEYYIMGSVVGIATAYGLEGPGIESRWGEIFRTCPDRPWGPPSLLYNGYQVFPGGKVVRGVTLTPHPLLVQRSKIE